MRSVPPDDENLKPLNLTCQERSLSGSPFCLKPGIHIACRLRVFFQAVHSFPNWWVRVAASSPYFPEFIQRPTASLICGNPPESPVCLSDQAALLLKLAPCRRRCRREHPGKDPKSTAKKRVNADGSLKVMIILGKCQ